MTSKIQQEPLVIKDMAGRLQKNLLGWLQVQYREDALELTQELPDHIYSHTPSPDFAKIYPTDS